MHATTAIGLATAIVLGATLAAPAGEMSGKGGGGGGGGGGVSHAAASSGGGISQGASGVSHGATFTGGGISQGASGVSHGATFTGGNVSAVRSSGPVGGNERHEMSGMRMGDRDHDRGRDHDHDRHDHDRFRFFPAFAFGVDNYYSDSYYPNYTDCWEIHKVRTHAGWRLRRIWVCN